MEVVCPFQIKLESPTVSFPEYLFQRFHKYGRNLAMVKYETGEKWLYKDIKPWVDQCTTLIRECLGTGTGHRIGVALVNCPEVIIIQLACGVLGVTCVMLSPNYTIDEIWHQVDLSEVSHVITEEQFAQKLEDVRKKTMARGNARFKKIIDLKEVVIEPPNLDSKSSGLRKQSVQPGRGPVREPVKDKQPLKKPAAEHNSTSYDTCSNEDSAGSLCESQRGTRYPTYILYFSSGTTGLPKAVELTHRSLIVNMQQMSAPYLHPPSAKDRILWQLPLQHMYGALVAYYTLFSGCTAVTLERYRLDCFLSAIQEYKISVLHCVPPQVFQLAYSTTVDDYDLSSISSVTSAGAPLGSEIGEKCRERLNLHDIRQLFGMTELGGVGLWSRYGSVDISSVGIPLPGTICKIVHPDKKHMLQAGEMGELCIKGPQVIFKYYKNPKSTLEMFDKEGFMKTGDLAYYTIEGSVYIVDRLKDLIKYKSNQVSPSELEKLLREHPGVADCAVVGRADQVAGEVPAAFIVKTTTHNNMAAQEIRQFVRGRVSTFKELRGGIFFVNEIPRGVSGKINRKSLKGFWERKESKTNLLSDPNATLDVSGSKPISSAYSQSNFGSTPAVNNPRTTKGATKSRL